MEVDGKEWKIHPVTNMSSLTQSHLIDCPLLLGHLWGFEFYEKKQNNESRVKHAPLKSLKCTMPSTYRTIIHTTWFFFPRGSSCKEDKRRLKFWQQWKCDSVVVTVNTNHHIPQSLKNWVTSKCVFLIVKLKAYTRQHLCYGKNMLQPSLLN